MAEEKRKVGRPANKEKLEKTLQDLSTDELKEIIKKLKEDLKVTENQRDSYKNMAEDGIQKYNEQLKKTQQQYETQLHKAYKRLAVFIKFIELETDVLNIMKGE